MVTLEPLDAVVFDLDGTLIDTEPTYRRAFMAAAGELGLAVDPVFYASLVGVSRLERVELLRSMFGPAFPKDRFFAAYYRHRAAMLPARIALRPGVAGLLSQMAGPKAVATSASRHTALLHLERAGIARHFSCVATRDDVARGKPAPDVFLHAAERLDVSSRRCVAFEDSRPGVQSASAAGMRVVFVGARVPDDVAALCHDVVGTFADVRLTAAAGARRVFAGA